MSWWGKAVGGTVGFMLGGPLGALIGAGLGHTLDKGGGNRDKTGKWSNSRSGRGPYDVNERTQLAFFTATFAVMGYVAKADGRVSEAEIELATTLMDQMRLDTEQREVARRLFSEGKSETFNLTPALAQFRVECHRSRNLVRMFMEIQVQAAYADSTLHVGEQAVLRQVANELRISAFELAQIDALVQATFGIGPEIDSSPSTRATLTDAYSVLGVSPHASDDEVKRAYRRKMSQHHPDKLVSRGLPDEMFALANERTQQVKAAWETVKAARAPMPR